MLEKAQSSVPFHGQLCSTKSNRTRCWALLGSGEATTVSQSNHTSENKLINTYIFMYMLTNCYINTQHIHSLLIIVVLISALPNLLESHKHFFTELFYISVMIPRLLSPLHNPPKWLESSSFTHQETLSSIQGDQ